MIVTYPKELGVPINRQMSINMVCAMLICFGSYTEEPDVMELPELDFKYFEIKTPEQHTRVVNALADKIGHKLTFRCFYNQKGLLTAIMCTNFTEFMPSNFNSWTFVDDHVSEIFASTLN